MGNAVVIRAETPYRPEEAGYQGERIEVLDQHFLRMIEKKEIISGSYCLSRGGKVFADAAMGGLSYVEKDERRFKPDTIFRIASITKIFTAVAVLKLVEDGKIRLDQPVGEIIEEFNTPPFRDITIAHLMTHTSGIVEDEGVHENKYFEGFWTLVNQGTEVNWVVAILKKGLSTPPGKEWSYSSAGYAILGEIISRVSGTFCHEYIEKFILEPCEMKDTCFGKRMEWIDRYNIRSQWTAEDLEAFRSGKADRRKGMEKIPSTTNGIYSTCRDLTKFGQMLLNNGKYNGKRIVGRKALEVMRRNHTAPEVKTYCWGAKGEYKPYGMGPEVFLEYNLSQMVTPGVITHEGYGACSLCVDFTENFVAVWTAQFHDEDWYCQALRNVASIMWSGLE